MPFTNPRHALAMSKLVADDGRPRPWWMRTATEGSRCLRVTEVLMSRPTWSGRMPASASAFLPASIAASSKVWPSPQLRRSCTPATRCRSPVGSFSRLSAGASRRSISSDVVTRVAIVVATDRRATLRWVVVAFPSNGGSYRVVFEGCGSHTARSSRESLVPHKLGVAPVDSCCRAREFPPIAVAGPRRSAGEAAFRTTRRRVRRVPQPGRRRRPRRAGCSRGPGGAAGRRSR
jgi:hypothetical protein